EPAELAVAARHARLVAEALLDLQGLSVAALCLLVVAAVLGEHAEVMDVGGPTGRGIRQPGEGVPAEGILALPGSPGVELEADTLGEAAGLLEVAGLDQVMAGLDQVVDVGAAVLGPGLGAPPPVGGGGPVGGGELFVAALVLP